VIKYEFEKLALRGNEEIGADMYESVEYFYMSENNYHVKHGGIDENKMDFVKRVFGGKVNTSKTIAKKLADESVRENNWALRGNEGCDKKKLAHYERLIRYHYDQMLKFAM